MKDENGNSFWQLIIFSKFQTSAKQNQLNELYSLELNSHHSVLKCLRGMTAPSFGFGTVRLQMLEVTSSHAALLYNPIPTRARATTGSSGFA